MARPTESLDIASLFNRRWVSRVRPVLFFLCILVALAGFAILVGWRFDITLLKSVSSEWATAKPIAAVALIFSALSLAFQLESKLLFFRGMAFVGKTLGLAVLLIGISDPYFARDIHQIEPLTSMTLSLLGIALLNLKGDTSRKHPISHLLGFAVIALSFLPTIGYLYGTPFQIGLGTYCDMALPTSLGCLMMGVGVLFARLDHDIAAVMVSEGPGGQLARRLLPASLLVLVVLGWLRVEGERLHLLSLSFGTAAFTTAAIVGVAGLIWRQSVVLQKVEIRRRRMVDEQERMQIEGALRDQFISMLSHDLRTPLTAASVQAQLIAQRTNDLAACKQGASNIERILRRADELIRNLLDASQISAGNELPLRIESVDLSSVLDSAIRDLTLIHGNRFVTDWTHPIAGYWDPRALVRSVENLCGNAVKYGAKGAPIHVSVEVKEKKVRINVRNEGNEIPLKDQARLFGLFQRASQGSAQVGWGIGLALVRGIAEAHGGRVLVESGKGEGTTFTIELPEDCRQQRKST